MDADDDDLPSDDGMDSKSDARTPEDIEPSSPAQTPRRSEASDEMMLETPLQELFHLSKEVSAGPLRRKNMMVDWKTL